VFAGCTADRGPQHLVMLQSQRYRADMTHPITPQQLREVDGVVYRRVPGIKA
jgi:hypothetical protein